MCPRGEPPAHRAAGQPPNDQTRTRSPARRAVGTRRMRAHGVGPYRGRRRRCDRIPPRPAVVRRAGARPGPGPVLELQLAQGPDARQRRAVARGYGSGSRADGAGRRSRRADPPPFVDVRAPLEGHDRRWQQALRPAGRGGHRCGGGGARRAGCASRAPDCGPVRHRGQRAGATGRPHPRFVRRRAVRSFTPHWRATPRLPTPSHGAGSASLPACR